MIGGSSLMVLVAGVWLVERAFEVRVNIATYRASLTQRLSDCLRDQFNWLWLTNLDNRTRLGLAKGNPR